VIAFVILIVGCAPVNHRVDTDISEEIIIKAKELVDFIDPSMKDEKIEISDQDFMDQIELYQQILADEGILTKEMGQEMIESTKQVLIQDGYSDFTKYLIFAGNIFGIYSHAIEDCTLTQDEKHLDDVIHSMYFIAAEYNTRKASGSAYSMAFYVGDSPEKKEKADMRLKEIEEIKLKDTKVLLEDYQNLYNEFVELAR